MRLDSQTGFINQAQVVASPNCDDRENFSEPEALIIHCISLPPGEYGGTAVNDLFLNQLDPAAHPYFAEIAALKVSSHFLIRRDGALVQYVSTLQRAWHAGESYCLSKPKANDFSLGIELEGLDTDENGYTSPQYQTLAELIKALRKVYPQLTDDRIFAHSDIAPGRKTDPGPFFKWSKVFAA